MSRTIPLFRIALAIEKRRTGSHFVMLRIGQIERSLMRCGSFLNSIFQLALIL
jgi:hypothetical protein